MKPMLTLLPALLLAPLVALRGADGPTLTLHHAGGHVEVLNHIEELAERLAQTTAAGDLRLVVGGEHVLRNPVRLALQTGQRLLIDGNGPDALIDLGKLPETKAAICLESGEFEVRGLSLRNGPAWCLQISDGVCYRLARLRILDARGGGIVVWGPCGIDCRGRSGNRIEECLVERFNTTNAKWANDALSISDNAAVIARNVIRDSPTETMGIRVMGAGNHVESNLVENVSNGDAGGIYLWSGEAIYTAVGNVVRHNIVVGSARGIYLDDGTCATRVEQNYLVDCREVAVFIGGGRDNRVDQNIALRCPIFAHLDNRRIGWRDLPEKAAMFAAARIRLAKALQISEDRTRINSAGLDVRAFETLDESVFNEPAGNLIIRNLLIPTGQQLRWQNYASPGHALTGSATDSARPNLTSLRSTDDWRVLTSDIPGMPPVQALLKCMPANP